MPTPIIVPATPVGNTTYRDKWEGEMDLAKYVKHVVAAMADNPAKHGAHGKLLDLIIPNQSAINKLAGLIEEEGEYVPGLNIINKRIAVT